MSMGPKSCRALCISSRTLSLGSSSADVIPSGSLTRRSIPRWSGASAVVLGNTIVDATKCSPCFSVGSSVPGINLAWLC